MKNINRKGFTLVEIMIVVAIIALLAAIAIPNLLRARQAANMSRAQANLKTFATANETFSTANNGSYATAETDLTGATPPYIAAAFCGTTSSGYTYNCIWGAGVYTFSAVPTNSGTSGTATYYIDTGALLTEIPAP